MSLCTYNRCFDGKTVLVTGGAGFIGSHLTEQLVQLGACVRVLDDLSTGDLQNLQGLDVVCKEGSILDVPLVQQLCHGCQYIFHLAAFVSVQKSVVQPDLCHAVNVEGTKNIINAATNSTCKRIVFASSAACYGNSPSLPCREHAIAKPSSPYAESKCEAEQFLVNMDPSNNCDSVSLRFFNVFGERQHANSTYAAVIAAFAEALTNHESPIVYGDGSQTRDFIHVSNVVHAILLAAAYEGTLCGAILNVGTGRSLSVLEVLGIMSKNNAVQVQFKPKREGDIQHSCADINAIQSLLGFSLDPNRVQELELMVNPKQRSTRSHSQPAGI